MIQINHYLRGDEQECFYIFTHPFCVVANILLNHYIKYTIFVKMTKGGFTG